MAYCHTVSSTWLRTWVCRFLLRRAGLQERLYSPALVRHRTSLYQWKKKNKQSKQNQGIVASSNIEESFAPLPTFDPQKMFKRDTMMSSAGDPSQPVAMTLDAVRHFSWNACVETTKTLPRFVPLLQSFLSFLFLPSSLPCFFVVARNAHRRLCAAI